MTGAALPDPRPGRRAGTDRRETGAAITAPQRVLFVCTANTARSHLAAALWRQASPIAAASAGTHPGERDPPRGAARPPTGTACTLPESHPRLLDRRRRGGDLLITVCDRAHEELGDLGWAHWSIPDPVPQGTNRAFDTAYDDLATG